MFPGLEAAALNLLTRRKGALLVITKAARPPATAFAASAKHASPDGSRPEEEFAKKPTTSPSAYSKKLPKRTAPRELPAALRSHKATLGAQQIATEILRAKESGSPPWMPVLRIC